MSTAVSGSMECAIRNHRLFASPKRRGFYPPCSICYDRSCADDILAEQNPVGLNRGQIPLRLGVSCQRLPPIIPNSRPLAIVFVPEGPFFPRPLTLPPLSPVQNPLLPHGGHPARPAKRFLLLPWINRAHRSEHAPGRFL